MANIAKIVTDLIAESIQISGIAVHHFGASRADYEAAKTELLGSADHEDSTEVLDAGDGNRFDAWGTTDGSEWRVCFECLAT